jgi:hypothetical protein
LGINLVQDRRERNSGKRRENEKVLSINTTTRLDYFDVLFASRVPSMYAERLPPARENEKVFGINTNHDTIRVDYLDVLFGSSVSSMPASTLPPTNMLAKICAEV